MAPFNNNEPRHPENLDGLSSSIISDYLDQDLRGRYGEESISELMQRNGLRAATARHHIPRISRHLSYFKIIDHVVPCQHTRHYPGAVETGHQNELKLAVKQYVPLTNSNLPPAENAITVIGAHANGFPKEMYEPMWDDMYERLSSRGTKMCSIWVADVASQGQSGTLNETILGTDPSWWDHIRDLLFLINQKQKDMPQPLVAVGHSMGACHLAGLSLLHPRLFQALVLIDPVIQLGNPSTSFAAPSTYRRDIWPSRSDAVAAFKKSKYYQKWDSRVLDKWIEFGLRELPTELYPDVVGKGNAGDIGSQKPVTLATTKAQEVAMYLRPLYKRNTQLERDVYTDHDPEVDGKNDDFYRPESRELFHRLPEIFPPTQYIFGSTSELATPELRRQKMHTTGTGLSGNGGVAAGKVSSIVLECGHLVSFEATKECAVSAADFIHDELEKWNAKRQEFESRRRMKPRRERADIDDDWRHHIGPPPTRPRKPLTTDSS